MRSENVSSDDEIKLEEIWHRLVRRRRVALLAFIGCIGAAVLYLALARPVFESDAAFYIGSFDGELLDQPTLLTHRFGSGMGAHSGPGAWVVQSSSDRQDPRLIHVKVRGNSAKEAAELATTLVTEVVGQENARMAEITAGIERELRDLRELSGSAKGAPMKTGTEWGSIRMRIGDLEQLLSAKVVQAEVVQAPATAAGPVQPNRRLVMLLAAFGGLILALVATFSAEAVAKRRSV